MSEKQSLLFLVKDAIFDYETELSRLKTKITYLYSKSEPSDENTLGYFEELNLTRTKQRLIKARVAKLSKLSKKLKQEMK